MHLWPRRFLHAVNFPERVCDPRRIALECILTLAMPEPALSYCTGIKLIKDDSSEL